jgi:anti-anti-sigma factor
MMSVFRTAQRALPVTSEPRIGACRRRTRHPEKTEDASFSKRSITMKLTYATKHSHVRRIDDVVVLKPHGALMGGEETEELERLIAEIDVDKVPYLVINLVDVDMMNSTALSRIIAGHVKFQRRNARVVLCQLDARIQNILVITRLSMVLEVYPDEPTAIAASASSEENG